MALVNLVQAMKEADKSGGALGAFNVSCRDMAPAIIAAAEAADFPVVLQSQWPFLEYAGPAAGSAFLADLAQRARVPVVLQLDHAKTWEQVMTCLRNGFSSVMIDASHLPLEENVALVSEVVRVAHAMGVTVESELGRLSGTEGDVVVDQREASFTDPDEAQFFIEQTGVDALAVSVGTVHGPYRGKPKLDFQRLQKIAAQSSVVLVLHGASGVPAADLQEGIGLGVRKINFSTELREAWLMSMRQQLSENDADVLPCNRTAEAAVCQVVSEKISILRG